MEKWRTVRASSLCLQKKRAAEMGAQRPDLIQSPFPWYYLHGPLSPIRTQPSVQSWAKRELGSCGQPGWFLRCSTPKRGKGSRTSALRGSSSRCAQWQPCPMCIFQCWRVIAFSKKNHPVIPSEKSTKAWLSRCGGIEGGVNFDGLKGQLLQYTSKQHCHWNYWDYRMQPGFPNLN